MNQQQPYVVRKDETQVFYEGPEECREYLRNPQMWFGSSMVLPGDTGAVDPGHDGSWEIFYCVSGEADMDCGEDDSPKYHLRAGDTLVVPPPVPHRIHNRGTEPVLLVWAGAPGETDGTDAEDQDS